MPVIQAGDGVDLYYETWGRDDGEPVLLVMGLGADRRGWMFQRLAFGRRYRCVTLDNRGCGRSAKPEGPYSLEQMAADAMVVLDAEGIDSAHVVGASMGGVISQMIGVLHAERVRSLTLACTACRHHEWRRELLAEWERTALEEGMGALGAEALRWLVGPRIRRRFGVWMNLLARVVMSQPPTGFAGQIQAILDASDEMRNRLHEVSVPSLVVVGSQDILTPLGDSEELVERIPGSRLEVIPGAAHGVMAEAAGAFNDTVLSFLDEVTGVADGNGDAALAAG